MGPARLPPSRLPDTTGCELEGTARRSCNGRRVAGGEWKAADRRRCPQDSPQRRARSARFSSLSFGGDERGGALDGQEAAEAECDSLRRLHALIFSAIRNGAPLVGRFQASGPADERCARGVSPRRYFSIMRLDRGLYSGCRSLSFLFASSRLDSSNSLRSSYGLRSSNGLRSSHGLCSSYGLYFDGAAAACRRFAAGANFCSLSIRETMAIDVKAPL